MLLCDDAAAYRALVRYALEEDPAFVIVGEASDGRAALAAVAALRPDVVLLDLSMPHSEGLDAIATMRGRSPGTRVVALSGFPAADMEREACDHGAHAYVEKGTDMAALRGAVRAAASAVR